MPAMMQSYQGTWWWRHAGLGRQIMCSTCDLRRWDWVVGVYYCRCMLLQGVCYCGVYVIAGCMLLWGVCYCGCMLLQGVCYCGVYVIVGRMLLWGVCYCGVYCDRFIDQSHLFLFASLNSHITDVLPKRDKNCRDKLRDKLTQICSYFYNCVDLKCFISLNCWFVVLYYTKQNLY